MTRPGFTRRSLVALGAGALAAPALAASKDDELIDQLDREVLALKERIKIQEHQLEECGSGVAAKPDPIFPELVQVYSGSGVQVKRKGGRTLVIIPSDTLFAWDTGGLREEGAFALDLAATALGIHAEHTVLVTAHTDGQPPPKSLVRRYPTDWELSLGLAWMVGNALMTTYKLAPRRITLAGRGNADPNDTDDTPEGRAQNRRVVLTISPGKYP